MAITIIDKKNCTACEACSSICPQKCITMTEDEMGFRYPVVDANSCVMCKLCEKSCPILAYDRRMHYKMPKIYAARTKNDELRFCSTSGGIFSELADYIIEQNGIVCGAQYDANQFVEHCLVVNKKDIEKIRQSKYMQSKINNIYQQIREHLVFGRLVAFCGTPCQVAGLYSYLGQEYNNLYTFDFICRGVNSPKAFRYWLDEVEEKIGSKATRIWFKYKENGWKSSPRCTRVDFLNGQSKVYSGQENTFMCGYLGPNLYIRPSCGNCHFKGTPRLGDITLADFWGLNSTLEDDGGTSLVMINSAKGNSLFEKIKGRVLYEKHNFSEISAGNVCATDSVKINPKSELFLKSLGSSRFSALVKKYSKPSFLKRAKNRINRMVQRTLHQ